MLNWTRRGQDRRKPAEPAPAGEITNFNQLDLLCQKFGCKYERTKDHGGTIFVRAIFDNGTVLVGEGKSTVDAIDNLRKTLEGFR